MNPTVLSVLGIDPVHLGGNESWCRELSRQLAARGWQSVLCFDSPPSPTVQAFLSLPNVVFEVVRNSWRPDARAVRDFRTVLRRHQPAIVHLQFTGFLGPYPWLARLAGVDRVVMTDQGSQPVGFVPKRAKAWKRAAARLINFPVDDVICVSDYNRRCLETFDLLPAARYRRIYNSVDLARVDAASRDGAAFRRRYHIPDNAPLVVQVSWQIPEKGLADLIEAARAVVSHNPTVRFALVGEGAHRREFEMLAERRSVESHIVWTGMIEDPVAEGVFAAANVVCQVSRWEEAFGWVIAEAMAFGKPVVATRV